MNLNSIIFPAPTEDKTYELYRHKEEIIFVPKTLLNGITIHIPCLLQKSKKKSESNKFIFYFHGNAEDIFNSTSNLDLLRNSLPVNKNLKIFFSTTLYLSSILDIQFTIKKNHRTQYKKTL